MDTPETQGVDGGQEVSNLIMAAFNQPTNAIRTESTPVEVSVATDKNPAAAEIPGAEPALTNNAVTDAILRGEKPAAAEAPATPAVKAATTDTLPIEAAEEVDPYAGVLDNAFGEKTPATWTEEAKAAFKAEFGAEDPTAYRTDIETRLTAAELAKSELDKVSPVINAINSLSPAMQKAISMAIEGKEEEAQAFLRNTPGAILSNKEAKDLTDQELVEQRFPGKVKQSDWDALNDPETDPDVVDAIKTKVGHLREAAEILHNRDRDNIINSRAEEEQARAQQYEQFKQATAATISAAKSSPIGALLDNSVTEQISNGSFMDVFVDKNGTPTKDAGTRYLWALHGEKLMKAAEARGLQRGREEGSLQATSRQPTSTASARRTPGDQPKTVTVEDQANNLLFHALTARN